MLSLTRKTDYALVALADMGRRGVCTTCARELSEHLDVPVRVLTNILNRLTHCGLVESERGVNGGYRLARPPGEITLLDVIDAIEGPIRLAKCCSTDIGDPCRMESSCQIRQPIRKLHESLLGFLERVTLQDILCNTIPVSIDCGYEREAVAPEAEIRA